MTQKINSKQMKYRLFSICTLIIAILATTSCKPGDDAKSDNPNITTFTLTSAGTNKITSPTFTIDQINNLIYNVDSMPYLSDLDSIILGINGVELSSIIINDSIAYTGKDTLNLTQKDSIWITSISQNGLQSKKYLLEIRVHQVDPYKYVWKGVNSQIYTHAVNEEKLIYFNDQLCLFVNDGSTTYLYTSTDGDHWQSSTITGFPHSYELKYLVSNGRKLYIAQGTTIYSSEDASTWKQTTSATAIKHLLFVMNDKFYGLGEASVGSYYIAEADTSFAWTNLGNTPSGFPIEGAGICVASGSSGKERAYLAAGVDASNNLLNSVWSTENGAYWSNIGASGTFSPRRDVAIIQYDSILMLIGGQDGAGPVSDYQLISPNYGITWRLPNERIEISTLYTPRYLAQAVITDNRYIYLVGGRTTTTWLKDAWRGFKYQRIF